MHRQISGGKSRTPPFLVVVVGAGEEAEEMVGVGAGVEQVVLHVGA